MKCIGFGPYEGKCDNEAGTVRTPYWCQRCDDMRIEHIDRQFERIAERTTLEEVKRG